MNEQNSRPEKRQITRNRASYSCQNCRRRKVKCDKVHPTCGGCQKTKDICVYGQVDENGDAPLAALSNGITNPVHGKRRKAEFDSPLRHPPQTVTSSLGNGDYANNLGAVEQQLQRLSTLIEDLKRESANGDGSTDILTPVSTRSQRDSDKDASPSFEDVVKYKAGHRGPSELSKPLSDLSLNGENNSKPLTALDPFWVYFNGEFDQLNTLMKGLSEVLGTKVRPGQCTGEKGSCSGVGQGEIEAPDFQEEEIVHESMSFHRLAHRGEPFLNPECECILGGGKDKSFLLQACNLKGITAKGSIEIFAGVPTEEQSHVLFRSYLSGVHSVMPLLPATLFMQKYREFWSWYYFNKDKDRVDLESLDIYCMPLMHAIWYAGSVSLSIKGLRRWFPQFTRAQLCASFHDNVIRYLAHLSFPMRCYLPTLASFLIILSIPGQEDDPMRTSSYLNIAIRSAQTMSMHRNTVIDTLDPAEGEMYRRVWWHLLRLDIALAVSSAQTPMVVEGYFDTRMVSEIKESHLKRPETEQYEREVGEKRRQPDAVDDPFSGSSSSHVSVFALVLKGQSIIAVAMRKIAEMHLGTKFITKTSLQEMNQMIHNAEGEVKALIDRIPTKGIPELGFLPIVPDLNRDQCSRIVFSDSEPELGQMPTDDEVAFYAGVHPGEVPPVLLKYHRHKINAFHKWARITLSLMLDRIHCVAYAPFLKDFKSNLWGSARQCALRNCHSYMRKFLSLAKDPELQPFRWTWPGLHQPMHASMIVLVDLYERPESVEAPRSRAMIDQVFALSAPDQGIVGGDDGVTVLRPLREGGYDAWNMLRRLRHVAWRKAKLDPDFLWKEEDQFKVGVGSPLDESQKIAQSLREDSIYNPTSQPVEGLENHAIRTTLKDLHSEWKANGNSKPLFDSDVQREELPTDRLTNGQPPNCPASGVQLLRLPGQKRMPFPFRGHIPLHPLNGEEQQYHAPKKPESQRSQQSKNGNIQVIGIEHVVQNGAASQSPFSDARSFSQTTESTVDSMEKQCSKTSDEHFPTSSTNTIPLGVPASYVRPWETVLPTVAAPPASTFDSNGPRIDQKMELDSQDTMLDLGFDWDHWDAVFGQFPAYSLEMMQDMVSTEE